MFFFSLPITPFSLSPNILAISKRPKHYPVRAEPLRLWHRFVSRTLSFLYVSGFQFHIFLHILYFNFPLCKSSGLARPSTSKTHLSPPLHIILYSLSTWIPKGNLLIFSCSSNEQVYALLAFLDLWERVSF